MRVLLDSCISPGARDALRAAGHEVEWVGDWSEDPGDDALLYLATSRGQVIVTLDKDFGTLAVVHGRSHAGVIRLVGFPTQLQGVMVAAALKKYGEALAAGSLVTVDPGRVRVRPSDREPE